MYNDSTITRFEFISSLERYSTGAYKPRKITLASKSTGIEIGTILLSSIKSK